MTSISFSNVVDIIDRLFLIAGLIFLFLGFAGVMIALLTYPEGPFKDEWFFLGMLAINSFMSLLGIVLILFHKKIIVNPKPERY